MRSRGTGDDEELYLRSDIMNAEEHYCFKLLENDSFCYLLMTPARFVQCVVHSPLAMLLYCFGIRTWRPRLTKTEFEALKPREVKILETSHSNTNLWPLRPDPDPSPDPNPDPNRR